MLTHIYMTSWGLAFYSHIRNNCNNHIVSLVGEALIHKISLILSLVIEVPVPSQESRMLCIFVLGHRFCMFLRVFDSFVELFCRYSRMYIAFFNSFRQYIICILATDYACHCHRLIGTDRKPKYPEKTVTTPTCRKTLSRQNKKNYYYVLPNTELLLPYFT